MGGENSKDGLPDDDTIDNTFDSAGGSKMNMTLGSGKGDGKSSRSTGKQGVTFLGLKTNTTQFVDTSISQYEDKTLDAILMGFLD